MSSARQLLGDLPPEEKRELLAQLLRERASQPRSFPASFAQQRLWFIDQLMPHSPAYNIPVAVRLTGPLDVAALEQSLNEVVCRHEVLRTTFAEREGSPIQVVSPALTIALPVVDLRALPPTEREREAARRAAAEARQPFDLARGPLFRAQLLRLADREHRLLLTLHHIVADGWSMGVLYRELGLLYSAVAAGQPSPLPALPLQYADFALWQRQWLQGAVLERQLTYWRQQLAGAPPVLALPTDHPRPRVQRFRGAQQQLRLPAGLTAALQQLSQQAGVTLFMTLLAAFQTLLGRYSGQEEVLVGTPVANRNRVELEGLIGFFVNTLVLRGDLAGDPSFRELLRRVRQGTLDAYAHQDLPFEKLIEELHPERSLSHTALFQVMFVLQNAPVPPLELAGLAASPGWVENGTAKVDLIFSLEEMGQSLQGTVQYNTDLFEAATITRMLGHFQTLLEGIVADPEERLSRLPLLRESERRQLLYDWNATSTGYPRDRTVHQLFEEQVERTPEAVAVVQEGQRLTYRELNRRANQLAHHLQELGVGPEVLVGICVERSLEMMVALLSILKAGGAYVPLDPNDPKERLALILEDTRAPVLLIQERLQRRLPPCRARIVCLDAHGKTISQGSQENPVNGATAESLAYVVYTSGSTGQPKGVCALHRGVVRLATDTSYAQLSADEVFLQLAPLTFDAATFEIWACLLNGGRLVVFPPHPLSLGRLEEVLQRHRVTTLWLTAGLFHSVLEERPESLKPLRQLLAGGDVLSVPHVRKALQRLEGVQLINGYGPTEGTTFTCCYAIEGEWPEDRSIPIGRPIANTQVYVLDRNRQPVPIGVPGELYIGGDGLARGYLNQPALTAERFVLVDSRSLMVDGPTKTAFSDPSAISHQPSTMKRLYRTGDLARYLPDGNLEFLGRVDHQVKIRGFRVEPEEIEVVLGQHPAVREAVVLAREVGGVADERARSPAVPPVRGYPAPVGSVPGSSEKRLVAYIVADGKAAPKASELRQFLKAKLPDYLVPAAFVPLEALPLTPNGKVDRQKLPAPELTRPEQEVAFVAPQDALELQLTGLWEKVLGVHPIGVRDNFFDLGGHSLLAVRLFVQLQKAFGKELPLVTLFQAPTVEQLATILRRDGWAPPWSPLVAIQPLGSKPPCFFIHGVGGNVVGYYDLARHMGPDQPVYGLQASGLDGNRPGLTRIEDLAAHYLAEIRAVQPEGPYCLGGLSFGGLVAFEMAQQLHAQGEKVALLAMLDTGGPGYGFAPMIQRLGCHIRNLARLKPKDRLIYLRVRTRAVLELVRRRIAAVALKSYERFRHPLPRALRTIQMINLQAARNYLPQPYPGRVTLFRASEQAVGSARDPNSGWGGLAEGGLEIHEVPGDHASIIEEPNVRTLAEKLSACLDRARQEAENGERDACCARP